MTVEECPLPLRAKAWIAALAAGALALALLPPQAPARAQPSWEAPRTQGVHETLDPALAPGDRPTVERRSGPDRYRTALAIASSDAWGDDTDDVMIATGSTFPDALAGSTIAGLAGSPILLVHDDLLDDPVMDEVVDTIAELGAQRLWLLGGTDAISNDIAGFLDDHTTVDEINRVFGPTRYETAAEIGKIAERAGSGELAVDDPDGGTQKVAFVTTGENFPDALAAGSGAYDIAAPIFLTTTAELHPAAATGLEDFDPDRVYVLGGTKAVSATVADELAADYDVQRLSGPSRHHTAAAVAEELEAEWGFLPQEVGLSNGGVFPDALAAGPFLGENRSPQVLVGTNSVDPGAEAGHTPTSEYLQARQCLLELLHVFGGTARITDATVDEARDHSACPEPDDLALTVEPETQAVGKTAVATAVATADEDPVEGAEVQFTTDHDDEGPVDPEDGTDITDEHGEATFQFTTVETGTVTVTAETDGLTDEATVGFGAPDVAQLEDAAAHAHEDAVTAVFNMGLEADQAVDAEQYALCPGTADADEPGGIDPAGCLPAQEVHLAPDSRLDELVLSFGSDEVEVGKSYVLLYLEGWNEVARVQDLLDRDVVSPDALDVTTDIGS